MTAQQENDVAVPRFIYVHRREKLGSGKESEIDVHGGAGLEQWVAESKWYQDRKVDMSLVKKLLDKAKMVKKDRQADVVRTWFFGHNGFTREHNYIRLSIDDQEIFHATPADADCYTDYTQVINLVIIVVNFAIVKSKQDYALHLG